MRIIKYYCDICKQEMERNTRASIMSFNPTTEVDTCQQCTETVLKYIEKLKGEEQ